MISSRCVRSLFLGLLVLGSYKLLSVTFTGPSGQIRTRKIISRTGLSVARRAEEEEKSRPAENIFEVGQEVECVVAGYSPPTGKDWMKGKKARRGRLDLAGLGNPRSELVTGAKVRGKVISISPLSVDVELDGKRIIGNLHIGEITPYRDVRIQTLLSVGDYVDARVRGFDNENQCWRLTTESNPKGKLEVGSKVKAKVVRVFEHAAHLEVDLDGLVVRARAFKHNLPNVKDDDDLKTLLPVDSETELCFVAWDMKGKAELVSCDHPWVTTLKAGTKVKGTVQFNRRYSASVTIPGQHKKMLVDAALWWSHYY